MWDSRPRQRFDRAATSTSGIPIRHSFRFFEIRLCDTASLLRLLRFDSNAYSTRHSSGLRLFFRLFFYRIFDSPLDFSSSDSLTFLSTAFSSSGSSTPFLPTLRLHSSTSSAFPTSRSSFLWIIRLLLFSASFSTRFRSISMRRRALVLANTFDHLLPASNDVYAVSDFKLQGASSAGSALRR